MLEFKDEKGKTIYIIKDDETEPTLVASEEVEDEEENKEEKDKQCDSMNSGDQLKKQVS